MPKWSHGVGAVIAGKYRITGTLGQGGMGSVYEAVNEAVGKRVAVKLLNADLAEQADFARRFELEARAASLINHPGIVDVLDFGRAEDGSPYMVMEHLQGLSVRALQKEVGRFSAALAAAVVLPVLEALAAAHRAEVVHRDLKPANVFLGIKPRSVKILDFGISKFSSASGGMTQTGTTLGTPAFMAPEQLMDGRAASPASDLYAVGAMLYALTTGHPPFEADSDFALVARVLNTQHRPLGELLPDAPPGFVALVDALLSKDPAQRPPSAEALAQQLRLLVTPDAETLFGLAEQLAPAPASTGSSPRLATPHHPDPHAEATQTAEPTRANSPAALAGGRGARPPPQPASRPWRYVGAFFGLAGVGALGMLFALQALAPGTSGGQLADGGFAYGRDAFASSMDKARGLADAGATEAALALLDAELSAAEKGADRRAEAFAARNRGNLAHDLQRCSEAAMLFLRALKLFEDANDKASVGLVANDLGLLGLDCPEIDRVTWFKQAVKARWEVRDLPGVRRSANNLGVAYLNNDDYENADHAYNEALIAATELKDTAAMMKIKSNLSFVWVLIAAGDSAKNGRNDMIFDKQSVAWKKARTNYLQSMAYAADAGLTQEEVCGPWERHIEICRRMGD